MCLGCKQGNRSLEGTGTIIFSLHKAIEELSIDLVNEKTVWILTSYLKQLILSNAAH